MPTHCWCTSLKRLVPPRTGHLLLHEPVTVPERRMPDTALLNRPGAGIGHDDPHPRRVRPRADLHVLPVTGVPTVQPPALRELRERSRAGLRDQRTGGPTHLCVQLTAQRGCRGLEILAEPQELLRTRHLLPPLVRRFRKLLELPDRQTVYLPGTDVEQVREQSEIALALLF